MKQLSLSLLALALVSTAAAQEERSSSSLYLAPQAKADSYLSYDISSQGKRFQPTWGLDQAWINEQNLRKGINHMGLENIGIGRTAFRTTKALTNDTDLASDVISVLRQRSNMFNIVSPTLPLVFTADQEAGSDSYYVVNKVANVDHWAANINSHVVWMQKMTQHPIAGVSPFNEPDYWTTEEGASETRHRDVAKILKEQYPLFADIAIVGGNTLNNDKAWSWFQTGQNYYDWGNTHQLAGSFDNYAAYYQNLKNAGKVGYNDEMHNVAEAMIGLEYGMTVGIWWGFDSRARGEFCQISRNGARIGYAENRGNWTAASVYRHDDGRVKAFIGSSERQATTTTYQLVSTDRDVYYDGYGPVREYLTTMPGGTGYQKGQTNAERVIDITFGENVPPCPVTAGTYCIVNYLSGGVIANPGSGSVITQQTYKAGSAPQQWNIAPATNRTGGDLSFYDIEAVSNKNIRMNVRNYSTYDNADVIAWTQDLPSSNEQWYLEYAGDGCYYLRNRESALYLTSKGSAKTASVCQMSLQKEGTAARSRQMWRLLPVDVAFEKNAPKAPSGLEAVSQPASVRLSWSVNTDSDVKDYMVLRAEKGTDEWNTIARQLTNTYYVDNTCRQGHTYLYKVKAVDAALNISAASETVEASATGEPSLIARWHLDGNLYDDTPNMMDGAAFGTPTFLSTDYKSGEGSAFFRANSYVQLPYEVASSDELTFACWVKWSTSTSWQRIFDFGNDTDHYLFLTPSNGSAMTFAIKNGGDEQTVKCPSRLTTNQWKHVAVSIGRNKTAIFIDGEEVASSTAITIRPSDVHPVLNYLGRSQFNADPYFGGYLDDVRIYNHALTATEVKAVMTDTTDGITELQTTDKTPTTIYDLNGRQLSAPQRGINIVGGKKRAF